jgi:hypothetical protein
VKSVELLTATNDTMGEVGEVGAVDIDDEPPHDHETTATRTRMRRFSVMETSYRTVT